MIFLNMNTGVQKDKTKPYTAPTPEESKRLLRKVWGNLQKLDRQDKGISNEYIHGGNQKTSMEYVDKKTGGAN